MDRDRFAASFRTATERARDFARTLVAEPLPDHITLRVRLNQSYDLNAHATERLYPEDSAFEKAFALRRCDLDTAIDELWRDGWVPEWINVSAIGATATTTLLEAVCCGRFTDDEAYLYHGPRGIPPFNVLGPGVPPDGEKLSIHRRTEVWDDEDLEHLRDVHATVWELELYTDVVALPELPALERLWHHCCATGGDPIAPLKLVPTLRIRFAPGAEPSLTTAHPLDGIALAQLPDRPWGCAQLEHASNIELDAEHTLWLDGAFPNATRVSLTAPRFEGHVELPERLDRLSLHTQHDFEALLEPIKALRALHLRRTPVSDELALELPGRFGLEYLDLVDTGVGAETLDRIRQSHPELRMHPRAPSRA